MKNNSTKRALIASLVVLALCFTSLVGTTFAWFTDEVTSSGNVITTGSLKVGMYWTEGNNDPDADTTVWADAKNGPIFNSKLWEPGRTEAKHLKITNEGTLALTYQMRIIPTGEVTKLADVIDVYFIYDVTDENDLAGAVQLDRASLNDANKLGTLSYCLDASNTNNIFKTITGHLEAKTEKTMTLVFKMQESAGNEYQELSIGDEFSIQLFATQYTSESDSFDNQYDAKANVITLADGAVVRLEEDGNTTLYNVKNVDVEDEVYYVPYGVTSIGFGSEATGGVELFKQNSNVKKVVFPETVDKIGYQAFKNSSVEEVVINEGITEIGEFAFNGATKLEKFNIPESVTTIGKRAFRSTAATEIVIPATVEVINESFRDMPYLAKVTIEGNTAISNYAFRDCPSLRTVILNGEDVTLGGGTTFCNASTNNPKVNDITFFVKNETVAERVRTAMGAGTYFEIIVPTTHTVTTQDGSQSLNVVLTEQAFDSIVYHNEMNQHASATYGKLIGSLTVYTKDDLKAAYELYKAGMFVNNGQNDVNNVLVFGADIDFGGEDFYGFNYRITVEGNGYTLSNINFVSPNGRQAGFISVGGDAIFNNLTIADATVSGAQAGIFGGNIDNAKLVNCALAGNITVNWVECTGESYNGVGAVWGCTSSVRATTKYGNSVEVDISEANITINKDGIYYPAGFAGDGNVYVGEAYNGSIYTLVIDGETYSVAAVANIDELKAALDNANSNTYVSFAADIAGDATVYQRANANVIVDGNGYTLTGHIYINGRSAATSPETLVIEDLTITSDYYVDDGECALINAYYAPTSGVGATRNIHNVTIQNCTLIATGANAKAIAAMDLYQPFNITVDNCTVKGAHSAIQVKGGDNIKVNKLTTIDCKNGVSFGTTKNASIANSNIQSVGEGGYGIRVEATVDETHNLTVNNCTISAFVPVLVRKSVANSVYNVTFEGNNVFTASAANTEAYQVVATASDWDNGANNIVAPAGTVNFIGADSYKVYEG